MWFILVILFFLSAFSNTSTIVTPFVECWFAFKIRVFFVNVQNFADFFLDKSVSVSLILFICEVVVWILFTYCSFRFSVSSSFIVISACSSFSSSFLESKSGSRIGKGCDALFF